MKINFIMTLTRSASQSHSRIVFHKLSLFTECILIVTFIAQVQFPNHHIFIMFHASKPQGFLWISDVLCTQNIFHCLSWAFSTLMLVTGNQLFSNKKTFKSIFYQKSINFQSKYKNFQDNVKTWLKRFHWKIGSPCTMKREIEKYTQSEARFIAELTVITLIF